MIIMTTGGFLSVTAANDPRRVNVTSTDREAIEFVVGGIELTYGEVNLNYLEATNEDMLTSFTVNVSREDLGRWLSHEIANHVDYFAFPEAILPEKGTAAAEVVGRVWYDIEGIVPPTKDSE